MSWPNREPRGNELVGGQLQYGLEHKYPDNDQHEPRHGAESRQDVAMGGKGGGGERVLHGDHGGLFSPVALPYQAIVKGWCRCRAKPGRGP